MGVGACVLDSEEGNGAQAPKLDEAWVSAGPSLAVVKRQVSRVETVGVEWYRIQDEVTRRKTVWLLATRPEEPAKLLESQS